MRTGWDLRPLDPQLCAERQRARLLMKALNDTKVIICPGVKVGKESVIGAGSVVTKDIPTGVVALGNPCRVIRSIDE